MPMNSEAYRKITATHLSRMAFLYVRQSTLRQVFENTESTQRQYALRDRAVALGACFVKSGTGISVIRGQGFQ